MRSDGLIYLRYPKTENGTNAQLFCNGHLQGPDVGEWEDNDRSIEDEVPDDGRHLLLLHLPALPFARPRGLRRSALSDKDRDKGNLISHAEGDEDSTSHTEGGLAIKDLHVEEEGR